MSRFAMVIDLRRCIGCNACVVACKAEHNTPNNILHTGVLEKETGRYPESKRIFLPVLCNHCEKALCVNVCPTGASYRRADGIIAIDWNKCIGCKACIEACPYDVRAPVEDNRIVYFDGKTEFENPTFSKCPTNVPTKCDFCSHRIDEGKYTPACVEICPTSTRSFGDLHDRKSKIQKHIQSKNWVLLPTKGTEPHVFYIDNSLKLEGGQ